MQTVFDTAPQMQVHLTVLRMIAGADGVVSAEEQAFLDNLENIYRLRFPEFDVNSEDISGAEFDSIIGTIQTKKAKLTLLQDLLCMAFADGDFSSSELAMIEDIAQRIAISKADLKRLFDLNDAVIEANRNLSSFLLQSEG